MKPEVVLLDEPLANLDVHLRESMLREFKEFHARTRATMIFVTHDQTEAMAVSDRIAVMNSGKLAQIATPQDIYDRPEDRNVARFVGKGSIVPVLVTDVHGETCSVDVWGHKTVFRCRRDQPPGKAYASLKHSDLGNGGGGLPCTVLNSVYRGGSTLFEVMPQANRNEADPLRLILPGHVVRKAGEQLAVSINTGWVLPDA